MNRQPLLRIFALTLWAQLPPRVQFYFSRIHSHLYELGVSKWFIRPYAFLNYIEGMEYTREFGPASGAGRYKNFQDYFTRKIAVPRDMESDYVWPCDGFLCEAGKLSDINVINVKGERREIRAVFGDEFAIPDDGYFANIFLHNSDYHRIHAPVSGEIKKIVHIPGELRFLRPWFYKQPSLPALTNERINIEILAKDQRGQFQSWFLSIVGGPGVSTIVMDSVVRVGQFVHVGQELSLFKLGSTCCMVSPNKIDEIVGAKVRMGDSFSSFK